MSNNTCKLVFQRVQSTSIINGQLQSIEFYKLKSSVCVDTNCITQAASAQTLDSSVSETNSRREEPRALKPSPLIGNVSKQAKLSCQWTNNQTGWKCSFKAINPKLIWKHHRLTHLRIARRHLRNAPRKQRDRFFVGRFSGKKSTAKKSQVSEPCQALT